MMSASSSVDGDGSAADDSTSPAATTSSTSTDFHSTSNSDTAHVLHVSFARDPSASLGVQLVNCDTVERATESLFLPGFAVVGRLLEGDDTAGKRPIIDYFMASMPPAALKQIL